MVLITLDDGTIVTVLGAALLDDPRYQEKLQAGVTAMKTASESISFTPKERSNPRGTSAACARGMSHGGGQKVSYSSPFLTDVDLVVVPGACYPPAQSAYRPDT